MHQLEFPSFITSRKVTTSATSRLTVVSIRLLEPTTTMVDPLNDKGRTLALPFPDLTGLRAAAHNRVTNPTFFRVERQSTLLFAQLRDITQKMAAVDVEEVILGAWAIVLVRRRTTWQRKMNTSLT